MKIICCAIHYVESKEKYIGIASNITEGELYIANRSHSDELMNRALYKAHKTSSIACERCGYLAVEEGNVIFVTRQEASKAENLKNASECVYSYEVRWGILTLDECEYVIQAKEEMFKMLESKGIMKNDLF